MRSQCPLVVDQRVAGAVWVGRFRGRPVGADRDVLDPQVVTALPGESRAQRGRERGPHIGDSAAVRDNHLLGRRLLLARKCQPHANMLKQAEIGRGSIG
jgi:hypothetical protein